MKIAFTGGGSGGHVTPIVAIVRELKRLHQEDDLQIYFIGPNDEFVQQSLPQEGVIIKKITAGKIRRYFSFSNIIDIAVKIPLGVIQSFFLLLFLRPQLVFSKGGTGSAQVCFAANVLRIPIFLHESDADPGQSNKTISKWAKKIFTSFPRTEFFDPAKIIPVGNPVKKELLEGSKAEAKELFNVTLEKPILLFIGGSQGAEAINDFVVTLISIALQKYEIIHVTGSKNFDRVTREAEAILDKSMQAYYHPKYQLNEIEMKHALAAADVVISRAGAGGIFEIAACGKPSILVPLAGHQSKNAYQYAATGAAIVLEQENLSPNFFVGKIDYLLDTPGKAEAMKNAALEFSKPLAAKALAREILEFLHSNEKSES